VVDISVAFVMVLLWRTFVIWAEDRLRSIVGKR